MQPEFEVARVGTLNVAFGVSRPCYDHLKLGQLLGTSPFLDALNASCFAPGSSATHAGRPPPPRLISFTLLKFADFGSVIAISAESRMRVRPLRSDIFFMYHHDWCTASTFV